MSSLLYAHKENKNFAFTLAEVLITLVIIGVIAAITVPVVIANQQKEELRVAFMKTYSDLNGFSRKFYSDNAMSFADYASAVGTPSVYQDKFLSYFNTVTATASNDIHSTASENRDNNYVLTGLNGGTSSGICDNTAFKSDISGRLYKFNDRPAADKNGPVICIDTNGQRGPNRMGKDYFLFIFTVDGRVIPMGMDDYYNTTDTNYSYNFFVKGSQYCSRNGKSINNAACAFYALADVNPNNPNKSYWKDFI